MKVSENEQIYDLSDGSAIFACGGYQAKSKVARSVLLNFLAWLDASLLLQNECLMQAHGTS